MKPIHQTVEALRDLSRSTGEDHLGPGLQRVADDVQVVVPDCLGLSVAWNDHGVTFTLVASDEEYAVYDALQYLEDGPCVSVVELPHGLETDHEGLMDEDRWRLFAQVTAASGVRSTLTMPLTARGRTVGTVNLYGASDHAFEGHHDDLAEILGAWAPGAVRNADLAFETRRAAELAPQSLRQQGAMNRAIGMVAIHRATDVVTARERIDDAAARAGITPDQLATALLRLDG